MATITGVDLLLCLSLLLILIGFTRGGCNRNVGPAGSNECILGRPYYSKYQWATCLTDQYIKTYIKGAHLCRDTSATYCWYQCMVEVHDIDEGPVYDDCACGADAPRNVTTQPTVVTSAIPDWCFSPSGTECSWYRDCLEKRYPCKEKGNSYALDYAEKFCKLYQNHYSEFDDKGQQWIDAVRKCLQVKLVPILRPFVKTTCEGIKQTAFDSHPGCYLQPDEGKLSICDIGFANWARVFWTVKSAVIQDARATFKQMLDVVQACGTELLNNGMELIKLKMKQTKDAIQRSLDEIAENVSDIISEKMDWFIRGIMHFGYPAQNRSNRKKRATVNDTDIDSFYINILIAASFEFDLNAENNPVANISAEAIDVAKAIENGDVRVKMEDGLEFTELSVCSNYNCTETSLQVTPAPPKEVENGGITSATVIIIVVVTTFGIVLVVLAVIVLRKMRKC
ncbi:uncharacterized protein LOC123535602 [Mercenaria mercenaria]|uniref:uncharacterized protein LOC123535602 n=1 Tax=Mercenaria mercenaria TaxID=6596 RepID=UPI00234F098B|nr:uncharacterized protein LOC123535602 [Mercenaria mercenaria]